MAKVKKKLTPSLMQKAIYLLLLSKKETNIFLILKKQQISFL